MINKFFSFWHYKVQSKFLIAVKYWSLQAEKTECSGSETGPTSLSSIEECADECNGQSEMFIYGRAGEEHCSNDGTCNCYCETAAKDGSCTETGNTRYNLYKYT